MIAWDLLNTLGRLRDSAAAEGLFRSDLQRRLNEDSENLNTEQRNIRDWIREMLEGPSPQ